MKNNYTGNDEMMQAANEAIKKSRGAAQKGSADSESIAHGITVVNNDTQSGIDRVDNPKKELNQFNEFMPLDEVEALPSFPTMALPLVVREYVEAAAESVQACVSLVACCVLGMLSIACRGRYPVCLPNGHVERPCFYLALEAPPSERKSSVISETQSPLIAYEIEYNQLHSASVAQSESELKLLKGKIARVESEAIKAKDPSQKLVIESELQELNQEMVNFKPVEELRLFGQDATPEKLAEMIKAQGEVFSLVSAEGGSIFSSIDRYNDRGGIDIYLNAFSGDMVRVDRKNSKSISINKPTLNIIAPCQPTVIKSLFADSEKAERGLLSRFLFVKCQSIRGTRQILSKPIDGKIKASYSNICRSMLAGEGKGELAFNDEAFALYSKFFYEIEPQLLPEVGELSHMAEWAGKLHTGQTVRLAGLVHCIRAFEGGIDPLSYPIDSEEMQAAITFARYFLAHAKAVYSEQAEPVKITHARYLWGKIKHLEAISKRELVRKTQGKHGFDLNDTLKTLIEYGYVRKAITKTGKAGRPAETIIINPEAQSTVTKLSKLTKSHSADNLGLDDDF